MATGLNLYLQDDSTEEEINAATVAHVDSLKLLQDAPLTYTDKSITL